MYLDCDSSPEDYTFPRTLGKVQSMRRENSTNRLVVTGLSAHFSWEIDSLLEVSTVDSPNINDACLTDVKTEPGFRRSKRLMGVIYKYILY